MRLEPGAPVERLGAWIVVGNFQAQSLQTAQAADLFGERQGLRAHALAAVSLIHEEFIHKP